MVFFLEKICYSRKNLLGASQGGGNESVRDLGNIQELLDQIRREQEGFPTAQRLVAAYIVENYHQIPFLSISTLAQNIGVSDNTVVKFCNHLGYGKFAEFKQVFADYAHSELVMFNMLAQNGEAPENDNSFFAQGMEDDLLSVRTTLTDPGNREKLPQLLEMIDRAEHIYVAGARGSAYMAGLLASTLRYLDLKVHEVTGGLGNYLDQLSIIEPEDLVIVFSFPRYTAQIVDGVRQLHEQGVPIALITDTGLSPALPYADLSFHCKVVSGYYFPCYAGCLSLIGVICRAAGVTRKKGAAEHVRQLESQLLEGGVFF